MNDIEIAVLSLEDVLEIRKLTPPVIYKILETIDTLKRLKNEQPS